MYTYASTAVGMKRDLLDFFFYVIKSHLHFVLPFIDSRSFDDGGCHPTKNELRVAVCVMCIVHKYSIYMTTYIIIHRSSSRYRFTCSAMTPEIFLS